MNCKTCKAPRIKDGAISRCSEGCPEDSQPWCKTVGIMAVDPGGHTGVAWGLFDATASMPDAIAQRRNSGSTTISGGERHQIRQLSALWRDFKRTCVRVGLLPPENVELVHEDFIPRRSLDEEGISPIRISWGVVGYQMGEYEEWERHGSGPAHVTTIRFQSASEGHAAASNQNLKDWGWWVVGREHERSAVKHICYRLKKRAVLKK